MRAAHSAEGWRAAISRRSVDLPSPDEWIISARRWRRTIRRGSDSSSNARMDDDSTATRIVRAISGGPRRTPRSGWSVVSYGHTAILMTIRMNSGRLGLRQRLRYFLQLASVKAPDASALVAVRLHQGRMP